MLYVFYVYFVICFFYLETYDSKHVWYISCGKHEVKHNNNHFNHEKMEHLHVTPSVIVLHLRAIFST